MTAWRDWSVHMEFETDFDLNEDEIDDLVDRLDAPVSFDPLAQRVTTTITMRETPADAVMARSTFRAESAFCMTKNLDMNGPWPMRLVQIEAMTTEEQDRRLGLPPDPTN